MDINRNYLFILLISTFHHSCFILNSFMIEMIKSKQDNVITKELIRTRKLDSSMLRFTRLFQVGKEDFQRDEGSVEYSCIMTEGKKK